MDSWPRVKDFVNMILFAAVTYSDLDMEQVEFDGVAGDYFDAAIDYAREYEHRINECIELAIKLEVPVQGLEADGEFGPKWDEVVKLCKESS